jgi:hypothetical protein
MARLRADRRGCQRSYPDFYGYYVSADWSEVIIKAVFLAALIKTKGNVVQIFKITRSQHGH